MNNFPLSDYKEEQSLDCYGMAICCCFNPFGTLLAVGCNDGRVILWDFLTRGIAKVISPHVMCVCSMSWNRTGHFLLTTCADNSLSLWNILLDTDVLNFTFPSPIRRVQFHPKFDHIFIVSVFYSQSVVFDLSKKIYSILPKCIKNDDVNVIAKFDKNGKHVYFGDGQGHVNIYRFLVEKFSNFVNMSDDDTVDNFSDSGQKKFRLVSHNDAFLECISCFKVIVNVAVMYIKDVEFSLNNEQILLNCSDRVIRLYYFKLLPVYKENDDIIHVKPIQSFQDSVTKCIWNRVGFSTDMEYVIGGCANNKHAMFIWCAESGTLHKMLIYQNIKGSYSLDLDWHPIRSFMISISNLGVVVVWSRAQEESWSAFAPDFKELETNVEYEERESEFDSFDEDASTKQMSLDEEEEEIIDVLSIDSSAQENFLLENVSVVETDVLKSYEKPLLFLPVTPFVNIMNESISSEKGDCIKSQIVHKMAMDQHSVEKVNLANIKKDFINVPNVPVHFVHPLNRVTGKRRHK